MVELDGERVLPSGFALVALLSEKLGYNALQKLLDLITFEEPSTPSLFYLVSALSRTAC